MRVTRLNLADKPCVECGTVFAPTNRQALTCGAACAYARTKRLTIAKRQQAQADRQPNRCMMCGRQVERGRLYCTDECQRQHRNARLRERYSQTEHMKIGPKYGLEVQHVETRTADLTPGICAECRGYGLDILGRQNHTRWCPAHPENAHGAA